MQMNMVVTNTTSTDFSAFWGGMGVMMILLLSLLMIGLFFLPMILYIRSFQKTAVVVNNAGGTVPVGLAWLLLMPIINIPLFFILLIKLREGIRNTGKYVSDQWWILGLISGIMMLGFSLIPAVFPEQSMRIHDGMMEVNDTEAAISFLVWLAWLFIVVLHWVRLVDIRHVFREEKKNKP